MNQINVKSAKTLADAKDLEDQNIKIAVQIARLSAELEEGWQN